MTIGEKLTALAGAARALNGTGVAWALGASAMLYLRGITDDFHDLDVTARAEDAEEVDRALSQIADARTVRPKTPEYRTHAFIEYVIGGTDLDAMCGFAIQNGDSAYDYIFGRDCVAGYADVNGESVPLGYLEDWYVLYLLMGRDRKADMLEAYFTQNGADRARIEKMLTDSVPDGVRARAKALITKLSFRD